MEKILTPSEFKLKNPNAYLGDYLTYLENAQTEVEKAIEDAKTFLKNDYSMIDSIHKQADAILEMVMLVEENIGQIVLKSVENLTLEELQSYFNYDEKNRLSDEKKAELEKEKNEIPACLEEIERQIAHNLCIYGRTKDCYEKEGAALFFSQTEKPIEYLEKKLGSFHAVESKEQLILLTSKFQKQLATAINTECKLQNVQLSSNEIDELSNKIMELFNTFVNFLKYSPNVPKDIKNLSKVMLSKTGISKVLSETFDNNNTAINLIIDLMNLKKINTPFYINLSSELKKSLTDERLHGKTYGTLLRVYRAFLKGEDLPSDDLNQAEKTQKNELKIRLEKVNYDLASLANERELQEQFLNNEEEMRSVLREEILEMIGNGVTSKDIDSSIKTDETSTNISLSEPSGLLLTKINDLERAKAILLGSKYHNFFKAVGHNSDRKVYNYCGVKITDEFALPFLEVEKRRQKQLDFLITLINNLSITHNSIKEIKSNIITRNIYKERLKELEDQYNVAVKNVFEDLRQNNLFYVNAPIISEASTVGNVIVLPPAEDQIEPTDFDKLNELGLKQTFCNMIPFADKSTQNRFLSKNNEFKNWKDYCQDLMQKQETLVHKLFSFTKSEDKYYNFDITFEECEQLKAVQTTMIEILNSVYEERKAVREVFEAPAMPLDPNIILELEYFLGKGANLSKDNLVYYMDQTEQKIAFYKDFVLGLQEYTVPANQVKKFYFERKKTI